MKRKSIREYIKEHRDGGMSVRPWQVLASIEGQAAYQEMKRVMGWGKKYKVHSMRKDSGGE